MAQIEACIIARLLDTDALTDVIDDKVWPVYAPQGAVEPFITLRLSETRRDYTMRRNDGLPTKTFEMNCWDTDYERLKTWADLARTAVDGYRQDAGGFQLRSIFIDDESDIQDPSQWGFEKPTFGVQYILVATFTETVPTYT